MKATVAEAVAEIRDELKLEAKKMIADLEDRFMRQLEDVNQSLFHCQMNMTSDIRNEMKKMLPSLACSKVRILPRMVIRSQSFYPSLAGFTWRTVLLECCI